MNARRSVEGGEVRMTPGQIAAGGAARTSPDRFVEVDGARIRYRVEGSGPPVVLIHGLGASLEVWEWTVPALRDRYTTIAFDFPGFGLSEPLSMAASPDGIAPVTLAILDAIGVKRAAIVGSSLGGGIAAVTAGTAPQRCTALVLVGAAGFDRPVSPIYRMLTLPGLGEAIVALLRRYPRLGVVGAFADPRRIPDRLVEVARRDLARAEVRRTVLKVMRATAGFRGVNREVVAKIRNAAARITAPTLLVWGTADRVVPPAQASVAAGIIPGARVHLMPDIGHVPFIEAAGAFNETLAAFLAGAGETASLAGAGETTSPPRAGEPAPAAPVS